MLRVPQYNVVWHKTPNRNNPAKVPMRKIASRICAVTLAAITPLFITSTILNLPGATGHVISVVQGVKITQPVGTRYIEQDQLVELASYLRKISVTIKVETADGEGQGSGTLFHSEDCGWFIITANHVVEDTLKCNGKITAVRVLYYGPDIVGRATCRCEVVSHSAGYDLALLRVLSDDEAFFSTSGRFSPERYLPPGSTLIHCGSFHGEEHGHNSISTGIVAALSRTVLGTYVDQSTAPAFPGSSGGGMFDKEGRFVGVLVSGASDTLNYFVPIRKVREWAAKENLPLTIE